ncbi:thioesterase family protein [Kitasatospora sp. NPDC101157]|uniref:thioesterase family protein n=1 Tax=Kitasatospora sp. NPDC101157 TaxID=3364098 RepID=UPI0038094B72
MTTETDFDKATAVRPAEGTDDRYRADFSTDWLNHGHVNGGFLLAVAARALGERLAQGPARVDPFALSAHFLSRSAPGPVEIRTDVVRQGRQLSTGTASIVQTDQKGVQAERVRITGTYRDLDTLNDEVFTSATAPDLPPREECVSTETASNEILSRSQLHQHLDLRLDPRTTGWSNEEGPSGEGAARGWMRFRDGREPDPLALLLASDVLPPVTFDLGAAGLPLTVHMSVHVRAKPAPGWLRLSQRTSNYAGGFLEQDVEIWDSKDRLALQARHLIYVVPFSG